MAVSQDFAQLTALWTNRFRNITVDETASTLVVAVTTVFAVEVDNTALGAISYFKIYDLDAPAVGTAVPRFVFPIPASTKVFILLAEKDGYAFGTAVAVASVTTAGTAGTTGAIVKASVWTN